MENHGDYKWDECLLIRSARASKNHARFSESGAAVCDFIVDRFLSQAGIYHIAMQLTFRWNSIAWEDHYPT